MSSLCTLTPELMHFRCTNLLEVRTLWLYQLILRKYVVVYFFHSVGTERKKPNPLLDTAQFGGLNNKVFVVQQGHCTAASVSSLPTAAARVNFCPVQNMSIQHRSFHSREISSCSNGENGGKKWPIYFYTPTCIIVFTVLSLCFNLFTPLDCFVPVSQYILSYCFVPVSLIVALCLTGYSILSVSLMSYCFVSLLQ